MPGVYVAPSIWRSMDVRTATAVYASIASNPTNEPLHWEPLWNDALIGRSRSLMATSFVEAEHLQDCDVMVIVDDDVVWQAADFWKIVEGCRATRSIYGGVYVTRSTAPHISSRMKPGPVAIRQTVERRPIEIEYLATGFMAVHRDVFLAMLEGEFVDAEGTHRLRRVSRGADREFWPFFSPFVIENGDAPGTYHYLSEDWAFNERAKQLGFRVWADQSIVLQHMGWYPYTVADIGRPGDVGLPSTGTDLLSTQGRDRQTGEELLDSLVEDIAAWAGERPGDVRQFLATATEQLAGLWRNRGEVSEGEWYRQEAVGLAYILDLANWHIAGGGVPLAYAAGLAGKRVLDYGAGIGTFALAAARAGAAVWVEEPNAWSAEFLQWRAQNRGLEVRVARAGEGVELFDAVVCWHVFEHVSDPEELLEYLLGLLAPGGVLITESDFHADAAHPMHHEHADWAGVLERAGLMEESRGRYVRRAAVGAVA